MRRTSEAVRPKEATLKRPYETVVVYDATLPDDAIHGEIGKMEEFFKKNSDFERTEVMGKKYLAYTIRKKKSGVYCLFLYSADGDLAGTLDKHLKLNDAVLRHLTVVRAPSSTKRAQAVAAPVEQERA
jgi:small subunit ribosomal protein S6